MNNKKIEDGNKFILNPQSKTICFIQLTRTGDIVQTMRVAAATKMLLPTYRYVLVARKKFAEPILFLLKNIFSCVYYVDTNQITRTNSLNKSLNLINELIKEINSNETIDLLINLSFSKASSYLASLINADHKLGLNRDERGMLKISDKWSQYIYSTVMCGPLNPFSLEDIYKFIVGCAGTHITPAKQSKKENIVVIHPFASQSKKHWSSLRWSETINSLAKRHPHYKFIIVGGTEDIEKQDQIISQIFSDHRSSIVGYAGKKSLSEVYSTLLSASLFIGHDSLIGHLSSLVDIPSITVSLGTVRPIETSPYSPNNIILAPKTKCFPCFTSDKCEYFQCHVDIPYALVTEVASQLIENGQLNIKKIQEKVPPILLQKAKVLKSQFSNSGLLEQLDLTESESNITKVFSTFYRITWLYFLEEKEEKIKSPLLSGELIHQIKDLLPGLQYLYELSNFGKKYTQYLLTEALSQVPNLSKIKDYSAKIDEVDMLQDKVKENFPMLSPIVNYFKVLRSNLPGNNVIQLSQNCYLAYEEQVVFCSTIYDLVTQSIQKNTNTFTKPKTI